MFTDKTLYDVKREGRYAKDKWGESFDDLNTLNDWVAFITMYASDAAKISNIGDKDAQYSLMIKAAGLALNAAHRIENNMMSERHYDQSPPNNVEHGKGREWKE